MTTIMILRQARKQAITTKTRKRPRRAAGSLLCVTAAAAVVARDDPKRRNTITMIPQKWLLFTMLWMLLAFTSPGAAVAKLHDLRGNNRVRKAAASATTPSLFSSSSSSATIVCRITIEDTLYTANPSNNKTNAVVYGTEQIVCIPIVYLVNDNQNDELVMIEDPETYAMELPDDMTRTHSAQIQRGTLHVKITGIVDFHSNSGSLLEKESMKTSSPTTRMIVTTPLTTFTVLDEEAEKLLPSSPLTRHLSSTEDVDGGTRNDISNFGSKVVGNRRYALVRISTTDSTPMYTMDHMVYRFTDMRQGGMEAQYRDCSLQQLQFELTATYDVQLPYGMDYYGTNPGDLREAAMEIIQQQSNAETPFPGNVADHGKKMVGYVLDRRMIVMYECIRPFPKNNTLSLLLLLVLPFAQNSLVLYSTGYRNMGRQCCYESLALTI